MSLKLYLDTCIYNRPFDKQLDDQVRRETEAIYSIQAGIRNGIYRLIWSFILEYECNQMQDTVRYSKILNLVVECTNINVNKLSEYILNCANQFETFGLKDKDALHVACAVEAQADYFITCDHAILRRADKINLVRIINPIDFQFLHLKE